MTALDKLRSELNFSNNFIKIFLALSALWLACCSVLLFPAFRGMIIQFGEAFFHRSPDRLLWNNIFLSSAICGIALYFVFLLVFILEKLFPQEKPVTKRASLAFISLVSILFVFVIMFRANWIFGDDSSFLTTTVANKYQFFLDIFSIGRFYPLGYNHYNILLFIFRILGINAGLPVEAHFVVISVMCVLSVACLYVIFNRIEPFSNVAHPFISLFFAGTFVFMGSAFYAVYLSLIFPETPLILLFSVFMLMYHKALETDKRRYYAIALLAAVYSTYCKEPVFGVFLAIALVNHLFRYKKETKRERIFHFALVINGVLFLLLYYFLSYRNAMGIYSEGRLDMGRIKLLVYVLIKNPAFVIMLFFGFVRLFFVIAKKDREHLYYDGLLLAGIAYFVAYIFLRLNLDYYFMPAIILFLPSVVYWAKYLHEKKYAYALCLFFCLLPVYSLNGGQAAMKAINILNDRKEFMPYIAELLEARKNGRELVWYESDSMVTDYAFFITARGWKKNVINAFLGYQDKSGERDYFVVRRSMDQVDMDGGILFFYPVDNDQNQPMPDGLAKALESNSFELYKDSYGVLVYRQKAATNGR